MKITKKSLSFGTIFLAACVAGPTGMAVQLASGNRMAGIFASIAVGGAVGWMDAMLSSMHRTMMDIKYGDR